MADPTAARKARAWLKDLLAGWSPESVQTAQLLVSELVTNAVLRTEETIDVTAIRAGSQITVEVADRNPSAPVVKSYGRDAATGRGLRLVESLAQAWGVRRDQDRKVVWFRVVDGPQQRSGQVDEWSEYDVVVTAGPPGPAGEAVSVCLRELPVPVYLAAEEHHDALMREFALLRVGEDVGNFGMPERLRELVGALAEQFGNGNELRRAQVEAARRSGQSTADVEMPFPAGSQASVLEVAEQLDEIDGFCERAQLLTPPSTAEVKRFRRWYTEEVIRQLEGQDPSPWPFSTEAVSGPPVTDGGRPAVGRS